MVNYYIYAKDFSGSTSGYEYYHTNGLQTLGEFKADVEKIEKELLNAGEAPAESKIIYLHWGDRCYEVSEDECIRCYKEKKGDMATEPVTIITWLQENYNSDNNKIKLLYIITDGLINSDSAEQCFKMNDNMEYETVVFHAFNTDRSYIDLSVAASFFKSRCMVYCNYELYDDINISEDFDYDKIDVDNFEKEKEQMKSYIRLKFIKTVRSDARALKEIDKLKKFRGRLFSQLESREDKIKINLNTKDKNVFLREFANTDWYKDLFAEDVASAKVKIEKCISTLINYIVSDKKSYSFDALKYEKKFNQPVEEESIGDGNFTTEEEIEFPDIILDDDKGIPVIILTDLCLLHKIIYNQTKKQSQTFSASFSKFQSMMQCPLVLCNDTDISESIGYFYTLNVYKQLLANDKKTEPRTRRPFHGGLVLTETNEFDKYNDFILSATYFEGKKVHYNKGLFYYVLWKNCENKEWMDRNVVERFKKYAMRRISETVCKIGLSSLPLDPPELASLPTALWYCVELSSTIFKNDRHNFIHERLRMFHGVAHYMIEILKYFNYDLDFKSIEKRKDLIQHVMTLKRISQPKEKNYYLLKNIFKNLNGFLVSEIENPSNLYKLNYLKLNHKDILPDDATKGTVHLNDYVHLMHFVSRPESEKGTVDICEKTFRPYFITDQNKSFYTDLIKVIRKVVINNDDDMDKINITIDTIDSLEFNRILSLYNLFIRSVKYYKRYPTYPEYLEYISKRKKFQNGLVTIFPTYTFVDAEDVYRRYQSIMAKVDVQTFIEVSKSYIERSKRIKAEQVIKFKDDEEISQFITGEESRVRLKKSTG